jgi:hypothetical protein
MNLDQIARQMRADICSNPNGWLRSAPAEDLVVALQRNQEHYRLALGRDGLALAPADIRRVASAFGVPEGTEPTVSQIQKRHPRSGRLINWYVVELRWTEFGCQ